MLKKTTVKFKSQFKPKKSILALKSEKAYLICHIIQEKKHLSCRVLFNGSEAPVVSTDEEKDSSNPAQSGIRNSNCFGSKGFTWRFKMRMLQDNLGYTIL